MQLIDKIRRYLLKQPGLKFFKKNDSGSEYFTYNNTIIRLSDHVTYNTMQRRELNIIVNKNTFCILYNSRLINLNDYEEFKSFIKSYVILYDAFATMELKRVGDVDVSEVVPKTNHLYKFIKFNDKLYNVSDLSHAQAGEISTRITNKQIPTEIVLYNLINEYRKQ